MKGFIKDVVLFGRRDCLDLSLHFYAAICWFIYAVMLIIDKPC